MSNHPGFAAARNDGGCSDDYVQSSSEITFTQTLSFYRPDALPVAQTSIKTLKAI